MTLMENDLPYWHKEQTKEEWVKNLKGLFNFERMAMTGANERVYC